MKYKLFLFIQFFFIFYYSSHGQSLETKTFKIKNIGLLRIPVFLDTLGQSISKMYLVEKNLEMMSKSGIKKIETEYQIDLAKTYFKNYDSSIVVLLPNSTLINLLATDVLSKLGNDTSSNSSFDDFNVIPVISLKRGPAKNHSSLLKRALVKKIDTDNFANKLKDFYVSLINTLLPQVPITLISSKCYNYLGNYPTVKISLKYGVEGTDSVVYYRQDVFFIYRENYQYLFKFEYKNSDELNWKYYEEEFFKKIIFQ